MRHFYYLFVLILFNCRPSSSIIKNKLDLSNQQFRQIKSIDSVLFLVSKKFK